MQGVVGLFLGFFACSVFSIHAAKISFCG